MKPIGATNIELAGQRGKRGMARPRACKSPSAASDLDGESPGPAAAAGTPGRSSGKRRAFCARAGRQMLCHSGTRSKRPAFDRGFHRPIAGPDLARSRAPPPQPRAYTRRALALLPGARHASVRPRADQGGGEKHFRKSRSRRPSGQSRPEQRQRRRKPASADPAARVALKIPEAPPPQSNRPPAIRQRPGIRRRASRAAASPAARDRPSPRAAAPAATGRTRKANRPSASAVLPRGCSDQRHHRGQHLATQAGSGRAARPPQSAANSMAAKRILHPRRRPRVRRQAPGAPQAAKSKSAARESKTMRRDHAPHQNKIHHGRAPPGLWTSMAEDSSAPL